MRVSSHAVSRFRERVAPVSYEEAYRALSTQAARAIAFAGQAQCFVRLPGGQRMVIQNEVVVTVLSSNKRIKGKN